MYPLWGLESLLEEVMADVVETPAILDVVGVPGAPERRFAMAAADSLRAGGLTVELVEDAHEMDMIALGRAVGSLLGATDTVLVLARQNPPEAAARRLETLAAPSVHRVDVPAPTVDDVAVALDLGRDAAAGLHRAADGDDRRLVEILADLGESRSLAEIGTVLAGLANAEALPDISDLARQVLEVVMVADRPVGAPTLTHATGDEERAVLSAIDELVSAGLAIDGPEGLEGSGGARRFAAAMSVSRKAGANRRLGAALENGGRPGAGAAYERGDDWQGALRSQLAALDEDPDDEAAAASGLRAIGNGAATDDTTHGGLLMTRARHLRFSAFSAAALDDLRRAVTLLEGEQRIDALVFLAAVLDDHQRPQEADVTLAIGEWEATRIGANAKLGSLMSLRARTMSRLGFATEAGAVLDRSGEILARHGTARQQPNVRYNRAWIAFDKGNMGTAEQLFGDLITDGGDVSTVTDASAWHARALAGRGWLDESAATIAAVRAEADDPATAGAQFLASIAAHELAMRTGRFDDALDETSTELAYVALSLPAWENGTRYRQADALRALGRHDEARSAIAHSLELSGDGPDTLRWRLRAQVLEKRIAYEADGTFDQRAAENLTDVLLHAEWNAAALELMVLRARATGDSGVARQAMALAMDLGDPVSAAGAVDAADGWSDHPAIARAVQQTSGHIDDASRESWSSLPGITGALSQEIVETAIEPDWHAELRSWLDPAGLDDQRLSPSQRRQRGLVQRTAPPRRWGIAALAAGVAAAVVLVTMIGLLAAGVFDQPTPPTVVAATTTATTAVPTTTTTTIPLEPWQIQIEAPELLNGTFAFRGGDERTGIVEKTGLVEATGFYNRVSSPDPIRSAPVVFGEDAYVGGMDGFIHVVSLTGGRSRTIPMGGEIAAPLVVTRVNLGGVTAGERRTLIYAANLDGRIAAFQGTGVFGEDDVGSPVSAAPIVTDEAVVIFTQDGRIIGYSHDLNTRHWELPSAEGLQIEGGFRASAAHHDGLIYAGTDTGHVYLVDLVAGSIIDVYEAGVAVAAAPVIAEGHVWIPAGTEVHAIEFGGVRPAVNVDRRTPLSVDATVSPIIIDDVMYVARNLSMLAINLKGTTLDDDIHWSQNTEGTINSSPVYANGVLYFGSDDGYVYAVRTDGTSKELLWKFFTGNLGVTTSVAVIDGAVVAANRFGDIVIIGGVPGDV